MKTRTRPHKMDYGESSNSSVTSLPTQQVNQDPPVALTQKPPLTEGTTVKRGRGRPPKITTEVNQKQQKRKLEKQEENIEKRKEQDQMNEKYEQERKDAEDKLRQVYENTLKITKRMPILTEGSIDVLKKIQSNLIDQLDQLNELNLESVDDNDYQQGYKMIYRVLDKVEEEIYAKEQNLLNEQRAKIEETKEMSSKKEIKTSCSADYKTVLNMGIAILGHKFKGQTIEWSKFFGVIRRLIHTNDRLDVTQKLAVLLHFTDGPAKTIIEDFDPDEDGYKKAYEALIRTYHNPELNRNQLTNILRSKRPIVINSDYKGLFELILTLEKLEKRLEDFNIPNWYLDEQVLPLARSLAPPIIKERMTKKRIMFYQPFVELLREHLRDLESQRKFAIYQPTTINNVLKQRINLVSTTEERKISCVFCGSKDHNSSKCDKYPTPQERQDQIKAKQLCFTCLKKGHMSRHCKTNTIKCRKCRGKHLDFICDYETHKREHTDDNEFNNKRQRTEPQSQSPALQQI